MGITTTYRNLKAAHRKLNALDAQYDPDPEAWDAADAEYRRCLAAHLKAQGFGPTPGNHQPHTDGNHAEPEPTPAGRT